MAGTGFRLMTIAFLAAVAVLASVVPGGSQGADWADSIRECWNDVSRNTSIRCYLAEGKLRGTLSAKDCVVEAIKSARAKDHEAAIRWILACHCGTSRSRMNQAIRDHKDEAIRFVVESYGAFVP